MVECSCVNHTATHVFYPFLVSLPLADTEEVAGGENIFKFFIRHEPLLHSQRIVSAATPPSPESGELSEAQPLWRMEHERLE